MTGPTVLLPVELNPAGLTRAYDDLGRIAAIVSPTGKAAATTPPVSTTPTNVPDIVTVYQHAARHTKSKTPRLIELFAREQPLTPTEIGIALGNGTPLTKAQARAVLRNLQQRRAPARQGRISRPVLVKEFAGYESEGAGRYGFSDEDKVALRGHLGVT